MKIENFDKLMNKLKNYLTIDEDNIEKKILDNPLTYHQYLDLYCNELRILSKLELDKKVMFGKLYEKIKFHGNVSWDTKAEIESQIYRNAEFYALHVRCNEQSVMVKQLEKSLENIKNISFQIKNKIMYRQLFGN
jgi:hypothetical protein